ncbi:Fidgetin-like protein [Schistosoma japonicum]|uniref:Fidgetin-like protein n=1 Tax=Schistosoma japonicum TaxID=6182 RepID=A0A4Z2DYL1_SCHJA|nr:Fidgetin-like protein [Schistosoma japonicum]
MLKTNKEDRAEYIRKILFSQFPERCNAFDVDLLLSEYAELVDNMKNGINNYAEGALRDAEGCKNESNHWRSALTVDMALSALEGVTSKETCILPKQSLPSDFDVAKFCSLLTGLFDGESHVSQVSEPVRNTNVHLSSIGHKRSSIDLVKHSSPKRHLEKAESADFNKKSSNDTEMIESEPTLFQTAGSLLEQNLKVKRNENCNKVSLTYGSSKRSLGSRRGVRSSFVPPFEKDSDSSTSKPTSNYDGECKLESVCDERLKQLDQKIIDMIMSEIMDSKSSVTWDDIAGLEFSKKTLQEIVILPMLRPDLFVGLRGPPKGLLLFGPPGTGKTLIGKCIASQSNSTFFSISSSSLTSKWVGEGEKLVRALFLVARIHQPSVIFIDEVDSLLTQRSETEHESSRRIKTEFLVQLDGIATSEDERILFIGATNRPQELDEAARRRFVKRLYIPLPTRSARKQIVQRLLQQNHHTLKEEDFWNIADQADGYSGADMANLCREAAMGPIRSLTIEAIQHIACDEVS